MPDYAFIAGLAEIADKILLADLGVFDLKIGLPDSMLASNRLFIICSMIGMDPKQSGYSVADSGFPYCHRTQNMLEWYPI